MVSCYVKHHAATYGHMPRAKKLEPISIRLDPDVRQGIAAGAKAADRSLSAHINRILRQHLRGATVVLGDSVREALERLAKAEKRSLAAYVELVLEDHIEDTTRTRAKAKPTGTKT
jgi:hypothetical protein